MTKNPKLKLCSLDFLFEALSIYVQWNLHKRGLWKRGTSENWVKKMQQIPSPTQMNLHKRGIGTNGESGWLKPCVPGTPFPQVPLYSENIVHPKEHAVGTAAILDFVVVIN